MSDETMDYTGDASQADEAIQSPETCVTKSPSSPSLQNKIKSEDGSDVETKPKAPDGGRLQFYFGNQNMYKLLFNMISWQILCRNLLKDWLVIPISLSNPLCLPIKNFVPLTSLEILHGFLLHYRWESCVRVERSAGKRQNVVGSCDAKNVLATSPPIVLDAGKYCTSGEQCIFQC